MIGDHPSSYGLIYPTDAGLDQAEGPDPPEVEELDFANGEAGPASPELAPAPGLVPGLEPVRVRVLVLVLVLVPELVLVLAHVLGLELELGRELVPELAVPASVRGHEPELPGLPVVAQLDVLSAWPKRVS